MLNFNKKKYVSFDNLKSFNGLLQSSLKEKIDGYKSEVDTKVQKKFTPKVSFSKDNKNSKQQNALWDKLFEGKVNVEVLTHGSGFGILRVSDEGVYVDFYNVDCPKTAFVLRKN